MDDSVIISEIFPNPAGADLKNEWVELYNASNQSIALGGWTLKDKSGKKITFAQHDVIEARSFLVIGGNDLRISLNNDGDALFLCDESGKEQDVFIYEKKVGDNNAVVKHNGEVIITTSATPGYANKITAPIKKTKASPKQKIEIQKESLALPLSTTSANVAKAISIPNASIMWTALIVGIVGAYCFLWIRKRINNAYPKKQSEYADNP